MQSSKALAIGLHGVQIVKARQMMKKFIERDAMSQGFFYKAKVWAQSMIKVQDRMRQMLARRHYKKMILREYWRDIVERCKKLMLRNQMSVLKPF